MHIPFTDYPPLILGNSKAELPDTENIPVYYFHILKSARLLYGVEEELFNLRGNVVFINFFQARSLAAAMNKKRDTLRFPESAVKAGQLNAMGLIDEILHYVFALYKSEESPDVMSTALGHLENSFPKSEIDRMIQKFTELYPGEGDLNREIILEEMILLYLANKNPAFDPFLELFDHSELRETTIYPQVIESLSGFFDAQPHFGPKSQNIFSMLEDPAKICPHSLTGQLEFMQREWGILLGEYLLRLLQAADFVKEEERPFISGPGPTRVYTYDEDEELERFTRDKEWMPRVVLLAKSTYVWLYQLSGKYKYQIDRFDQIPDEELDLIASRGFTALWLIGLWERSPASKRIKQICGNPEAEASAYSLMEYEIAADLGGWGALENLRHRCSLRGIRLSSDMVPNHTGIDSKWVINHPDWFVQLPHPPFPGYSYQGENLSGGQRVAVYIEDHYYDKSDAAVTFKRLDTHTGDERYIYHGNDGTSMPWNDTAQLNFLNPEVREAVIQTILHVARNFPIIRFDAAMTLTKRHIQRLWFPEPGAGGDIPSRAEHSLSREDFHRAIPKEFWREVVDRITAELPETLLIAEAFWMMEGYFVRTLGMHRVYNSAFMNMLKKEENEKYRNTIKNTLEFDPDILKRFLNFMSNPDEETAVEQFGDNSKYFGVCTMMATMPGLPMFGHGQIEGLKEKYGMEYRRSYWEEEENRGLIHRHDKEIFPLLKKRYLFAGVGNFLLFDVYNSGGAVNENVFAYCNSLDSETSLVVYNNSYQKAEGWIHMSAAFAVKQEDGSKQQVQRSLAQGLHLPADKNSFLLMRDHKSDLWYIRSCREIWDRGLYLSLEGYEAHVFLDAYTLTDNEYGHYNQLATELKGNGTPNVQQSMKEILLSPVHTMLGKALNNKTVRALLEYMQQPKTQKPKDGEKHIQNYIAFLEEAAIFVPEIIDTSSLEIQRGRLQGLLEAALFTGRVLGKEDAGELAENIILVLILLPFYLSMSDTFKNRGMAEQLLLRKPAGEALNGIVSKPDVEKILAMVELLTALEEPITDPALEDPSEFINALFETVEMSKFIGENRYKNILYFNKENFELAMEYILSVKTMFDHFAGLAEPAVKKRIQSRKTLLKKLLATASKAGYATEQFIALL